jgi:hypothetical protein
MMILPSIFTLSFLIFIQEWVFVTGSGTMCIFSLAAGFSRSSAPLVIFRALMGAGGSHFFK